MNQLQTSDAPSVVLMVAADPDEKRLAVLEELVQAKEVGLPQAPIREKHGVTQPQAASWIRALKEGRLKPKKADHPTLYRMMTRERLAKARETIRPNPPAKKAKRAKKKTEQARKPPSRPKVEVKTAPPPYTGRHDFITKTLERIATNHDDFEGVVAKCLTIIDEALG